MMPPHMWNGNIWVDRFKYRKKRQVKYAINSNDTIFPGTNLGMGTIHFPIGGRETEWEEISKSSSSDEG
jgi:hypothetical protein